MRKITGITPDYRQKTYPDRQYHALRLLHDEIGRMIGRLEKKLAKGRVDATGNVTEITDKITDSYGAYTSPVIIEEVLSTEWLGVRLKQSRWDDKKNLLIDVQSPTGRDISRNEEWVIGAEDYLLDTLLNMRGNIEEACQAIINDGRPDAVLRVKPSSMKMKMLTWHLFEQLEIETGMRELDRLSMLIMTMRSGSVQHGDFAALEHETNQDLLGRLLETYEKVDINKTGQDKIGKLYAFQEGKRPDFLSSMVTDLPGIDRVFLQDVGNNQEYNVAFDHGIIMGGDRVEIPDQIIDAAWMGLPGRPLTDLIDTPITRALGANILSVEESAGKGHLVLIIDQRMKEPPLCWPEGDAK